MERESERNSGQWTEARYRAFIISALRKATSRWGPKTLAKRNAKVSYGIYRCALCGTEGSPTAWRTYKSGKKKGQPKKVNNAVVDHIEPVVDPAVGFVSWDEYIDRMFCEADNFHVLCHNCHEVKCAEERAIRTKRERRDKLK